MAHGTARFAAASCLGLIALQAAGSRGGSGRISSLLNDANTMVGRLLDPKVPAIPDLANGGTWGAPPPGPVAQGAGAAAAWHPGLGYSAGAAARFHLPN